MASQPVVDVDSHVYEPSDVWEKYLDRDYGVTARSAGEFKEF